VFASAGVLCCTAGCTAGAHTLCTFHPVWACVSAYVNHTPVTCDPPLVRHHHHLDRRRPKPPPWPPLRCGHLHLTPPPSTPLETLCTSTLAQALARARVQVQVRVRVRVQARTRLLAAAAAAAAAVAAAVAVAVVPFPQLPLCPPSPRPRGEPQAGLARTLPSPLVRPRWTGAGCCSG
jgi:hypothetical protein